MLGTVARRESLLAPLPLVPCFATGATPVEKPKEQICFPALEGGVAERSEVGVGEGQNPCCELCFLGSVFPPIRPRRSAGAFLPLEGKEEDEAAQLLQPSRTNRDKSPLGGRQPFGLLRGGVKSRSCALASANCQLSTCPLLAVCCLLKSSLPSTRGSSAA